VRLNVAVEFVSATLFPYLEALMMAKTPATLSDKESPQNKAVIPETKSLKPRLLSLILGFCAGNQIEVN